MRTAIVVLAPLSPRAFYWRTGAIQGFRNSLGSTGCVGHGGRGGGCRRGWRGLRRMVGGHHLDLDVGREDGLEAALEVALDQVVERALAAGADENTVAAVD